MSPDLTFVKLNFSTNKTGGWHIVPWPCFEDLDAGGRWQVYQFIKLFAARLPIGQTLTFCPSFGQTFHNLG